MSKFETYQDEEEYGIKATNKTPFVWLANDGHLTIRGRSIPEDGGEFYENIFEWVENNIGNLSHSTVLEIELEYLNDISSKYLLQIIKRLNETCNKFTVVWKYENHDQDMLELGKMMSSLSRVNFDFRLLKNSVKLKKQNCIHMDDEARKQLVDKLLASRISVHDHDLSSHNPDYREKISARLDEKHSIRRQYLKKQRRGKFKVWMLVLPVGVLILWLTFSLADKITIIGRGEDPFLQIQWGVVAPSAVIIGILIYINIRDRIRKRKVK